jgi:carbamoyltransferase
MSSMSDPYLGPQYSEAQIEELLAERRLEATRRDDIPEFAAKLLAEHQLIGWFQGRMESGPRALGSRSILADPTRTASKKRLDERVKLREPFRPYCPSVLAESASAFLERPQSAPYMITSFDARADRRSEIPAVVHVDGTVRPQTVERADNPRFHELISAFGALTGEPLVLNTSFNVKGEPIVCHPRDAIRTFYDTALDCLIMGDMVLRKPG